MDNREVFDEERQIYYDDFGTQLQTKGFIVGNPNIELLLYLPNEHISETEHTLTPTYEQWQKLIQASDTATLVITDPTRKIIKAIVQKSARQVNEIFRWKIFKRDNFICQYCGADDRPLTIDEYLCQALGGPINEQNCKAACRPCNKAKGHMTIQEWEEYRSKRGLVYGK